jgi:hypothetical protein
VHTLVDERSQTLILGEQQLTFLNNAPRSYDVHFCALPQASQSIFDVDANDMRVRACMPRLLCLVLDISAHVRPLLTAWRRKFRSTDAF